MSAGDRLQIVLAAKNEISSELKQTKAEMNDLGRTAAALKKRMDAGEQGLQNEYEQTRRELEKNRLKQIELGRAASKAQTEIRQMTTEGTAGAKRMDRSMGGLNRSMDKTHRASSTLSAGWGKAMGILAGVTTAVAGAAVAFRFLSDSVNEARVANKALAQTGAALRSMGRTDRTAEDIEKMLDSLSAASGIDDDALREMTNTMLTFGNVTGDTFDRANELALDLSVAFDKDLRSSSVMVGKALNDPIKGLTALSRVGVSFTAQQQEQIKAFTESGQLAKAQKIILSELTRQVDGSAAAQADAIDKTTVAWGNFKEAVGQTAIDVAGAFADVGDLDPAKGLRRATRWIKQNKGEIIAALLEIGGGALRMGEYFLVAAANSMQAIGGMLTVMEPLFWAMEKSGIPVISQMGQALRGSGKKSLEAADGMLQAANDAAGLADKAFAARDRVSGLNDALNTIKNKKVRAEVKMTLVGVDEATSAAVKWANDMARRIRREINRDLRNNSWATGGPVLAGQSGLVGELGPELFVPTFGPAKIIGADGPEIRDFHQSGTVIPNHLLHLAAPAVSVSVPPQQQQAQPLVGTMIVQDGRDVEGALVRAQTRAARITRERGA